MDSLTLSIAIACITSVCAAIIGMLFVYERNEGDRLAEENAKLRAALEAKRKEAGTLSDEVKRLAPLMRGQSEAIESARREINSFHARGYYRNCYGTLQRYSEWFEFGDKKPRRKEKKRDDKAVVSEKAERKPHQLKEGMQVKGLTNKQKHEIHKACVDNGVHVEPIDHLLLGGFPWVWVCRGRVESVCAIPVDEDINIPFDEFIARIKGEWPA